MKKHLTFKDGKSDKFWIIETSGTSFTVMYGKTGTDGQTSTKEFDTEEKCMKEAEKLVSEKLKKGYGEGDNKASAAEPSNYIKEWEEIVNAEDLHKALIKHFSYLADTPGFDTVLEAIIKEAKKVEIKDDALVISFSRGNLVASTPAKKNHHKNWPPSFFNIIEKHEKISFGNIELGLNDRFDFDDIFSEGDLVYELFNGKAVKALSPLWENVRNKTHWLFHPKQKNTQGEPCLFPVEHELEDDGELIFINPGSLFLKLSAELLELNITFPQMNNSNAESEGETSSWENVLNDEWVAIFKEVCSNPEDMMNILKVRKIDKLNCSKINISDLKPLEILIEESKRKDIAFKIDRIYLNDTSVHDLSCLAKLKGILSINISKTPVEDLSPISNVEFIYANECQLLDFKTLRKSKVVTLELKESNVTNLKDAGKLSKLTTILLAGSTIDETGLKSFKTQNPQCWVDLDSYSHITNKEVQRAYELAIISPSRCRMYVESYPVDSLSDEDKIAICQIYWLALCHLKDKEFRSWIRDEKHNEDAMKKSIEKIRELLKKEPDNSIHQKFVQEIRKTYSKPISLYTTK